MSPTSKPRSLRRTVCALALPALPLTLLAGTLISPTDSTTNAVQLRAAAAHGSAWGAAALLELLATALMPLAVAAVVHVVRRRGAALANIGGVLGILGTVGMAAIAFRHLFIYGLAGIEPTAALRTLDRVDHSFGAVALPLMFAGPIAFVILAAAATRARVAPRWIPVGAFIFFVSDMVPIPGAEVVQMLVGLATFGTLALGILRLDDTSPGSTEPSSARRAVAVASEA
jgi:hypothetical protein